jgi:hypothetical protein
MISSSTLYLISFGARPGRDFILIARLLDSRGSSTKQRYFASEIAKAIKAQGRRIIKADLLRT